MKKITIQTIIDECIRDIHSRFSLLDDDSFQIVWLWVCKKIEFNLESKKGVFIRDFFFFYFQLKDTSGRNEGVFSFALDVTFLEKFGIQCSYDCIFPEGLLKERKSFPIRKEKEKFLLNGIEIRELSIQEIAKKAGTLSKIVKIVLDLLIRKIGYHISTGNKVEIHFNKIGTLKAHNKTCSFAFVPKKRIPIKFFSSKKTIAPSVFSTRNRWKILVSREYKKQKLKTTITTTKTKIQVYHDEDEKFINKKRDGNIKRRKEVKNKFKILENNISLQSTVPKEHKELKTPKRKWKKSLIVKNEPEKRNFKIIRRTRGGLQHLNNRIIHENEEKNKKKAKELQNYCKKPKECSQMIIEIKKKKRRVNGNSFLFNKSKIHNRIDEETKRLEHLGFNSHKSAKKAPKQQESMHSLLIKSNKLLQINQ